MPDDNAHSPASGRAGRFHTGPARQLIFAKVILHLAAWRDFALCFLPARNGNTGALRAGKSGAGAPVLSPWMRMAIITRPVSASVFSSQF
ncbi:hypothetical protein [Pantoea rodasii]|uniref:hypothetical protein n=1 Tax=Pantoea rodasii TaxID=1076549 RepID=UPI000FFB54E0|nr:hypothetical protein [Pantoea rodasii]